MTKPPRDATLNLRSTTNETRRLGPPPPLISQEQGTQFPPSSMLRKPTFASACAFLLASSLLGFCREAPVRPAAVERNASAWRSSRAFGRAYDQRRESRRESSHHRPVRLQARFAGAQGRCVELEAHLDCRSGHRRRCLSDPGSDRRRDIESVPARGRPTASVRRKGRQQHLRDGAARSPIRRSSSRARLRAMTSISSGSTARKVKLILVDAQCARIGSGIDPSIRLTTALPSRKYVASADDSAGLATDARLTAVLPC